MTRFRLTFTALATALLLVGGSAEALPFQPGEDLKLSVSYLSMSIGQVEMSVGEGVRSGVRVWPLAVHARTTGFFDRIHWINDRFVSNFDPVTLRTLDTRFDQHESGLDGVETIAFRDASAAIHDVSRRGSKDRVVPIHPGSIDLVAAIYILRAQDPVEAADMRIPILVGTRNWEMDARFGGYERVTTAAGQFDTIVMRCRTRFGGSFSAGREMTVWFTNDARRLPVKIEARYGIGTMRAELQSFRLAP